jgi:uncharacterized protein (TIGR02118 family)
MVKAIYVVYRRPELTREEFAKHWTEVHAPIAEKLPHIRSYTIHPVTAAMEIEGDKEADGFAVCVWDTQEDFEKALASPEMAAAGEDAAKMARHFEFYLVEDHTII